MTDTARPASATEAERTAEEEYLLASVRMAARKREGWAYGTLNALFLAHGRLFTPTPWPGGANPPGELGRCFTEAVSWAWASDGALAYVEGVALDEWAREEPHAWCAGPDGAALDLTWPRPGRAYLGLPVRADAAQHIMSETSGPLLYRAEGLISTTAERWMRDGLPDGLLVDIGRPVPRG
ncbi:hypothetical protein [Streptomyces albidoflavus]|uniref:hypothetical protein n=1 Tax=Streptomyces albidoflavus TaxID=1886 RepID=UPI0004BF9594|nr:hypothetical protein [Streptomyces albidoflavus]RZE35827.1 hypothetical protein C0Q95_29790 [Streptomyces albidoflavus]WTC33818.1 hypothetical protein OH749_31600 [Streptomyces albidoflavus]